MMIKFSINKTVPDLYDKCKMDHYSLISPEATHRDMATGSSVRSTA